MPPKGNLAEFVAKSENRFGPFLDYSKSVYKNSRTPIELICPHHGSFWQKPNTHLNSKHPCPKCSKKIYSNQQFIEKSKEKHGSKFTYDISVYSGYDSQITITCSEHGNFTTSPALHFSANNGGCPACATNKKLSKKEFVERSNKIHHNKYDYSLVDYKKNTNKVSIICPEHGVFKQTPSNHYKYGCIKCSGKFLFSTEEFITRASEVHDFKYDYSDSVYRGMFEKIHIFCKDHGQFISTPSNHIHGKRGCPKCSKRISRGEVQWLDGLGVSKKSRNVYLNINGRRFFVDGYSPEEKKVYEFDGDYWHGNPDLYDPEDIHPEAKVAFGELWERTKNKKRILEEAGFQVVSIWESDFKKWLKS